MAARLKYKILMVELMALEFLGSKVLYAGWPSHRLHGRQIFGWLPFWGRLSIE